MNDFTPAELAELLEEVADLRHENAVLLGLMAGGYAYFLRQFMVGQQNPQTLSAQWCDQTIVDALRRVLSTEERFGYEYLNEIEAVLQKMSQALPLQNYLDQARSQLPPDRQTP